MDTTIELEETLAAGYPAEQRHALSLDALFQPHIRFFLARHDGTAIGCAGVAFFPAFAELKRMYVRPLARGSGAAEALLARIEAVTCETGVVRPCLETGDRQLAAMHVYARTGFSRCAPFGPYAAMPAHKIVTSVFFEKHLASTSL